jgi:hypothetical protein
MSKITSDLKRNIAERQAITGRIVELLRKEIGELPDNPRITRISNAPRCFTMSLKGLGGNWSVEHHDFSIQYRRLLDKIERNPEDAVGVLRRAIASKGVAWPEAGKHRTLKFHPDVERNLVGLWKKLWKPEEAI